MERKSLSNVFSKATLNCFQRILSAPDTLQRYIGWDFLGIVDLPFCRKWVEVDERYQRQQEVLRERLSRLRTCGVKDCGAEAAASGGLRYYGVAAAAHADAHPHSRRVLVRLVLVLGSLGRSASRSPSSGVPPARSPPTHPRCYIYTASSVARGYVWYVPRARLQNAMQTRKTRLRSAPRRAALCVSHHFSPWRKQTTRSLICQNLLLTLSRITQSTILLLLQSGVSIIIHFLNYL